MRIIGGRNRGLKLARPRGREVRPILDRVRESLFGILRNDVPGARVADLFAGTGIIGIEALSRGAESCVFVERDPACLRTLRENVRRAHLEEQCETVRADAFRCVERLAGPFSLVFVDPPYRMLRSERNGDRVCNLVAVLGAPEVLAESGIVVLRSPADVRIAGHLGRLTQVDRRRYGSMRIAFFRHC